MDIHFNNYCVTILLLLLDQFFTFNENKGTIKRIIGRMKRIIGKTFKNKRIE